MLDRITALIPSIKPGDYAAVAKAAPAVAVGLVMIGAAGVSAFVWNKSAGRFLGKTRGKF
jgi:hypothetical protein